MIIHTNEKLIKRNARIGQISMILGMLVLGGGMYISFSLVEQYGLMMLALFFGFTLSQIGIYFSNRWGRKPRPDEMINSALKGLADSYSIYHFYKPSSHILVGPAGLWVFLTKDQRGKISYSKSKYHQKGGNLFLKIFAQESIGRPDIEIEDERRRLERFLSNQLDEDAIQEINTGLLFTHPNVELSIPEDVNLPAHTVEITKLKKLIRKFAKEKKLSMVDVDNLNAILTVS